MLVCRIAIRIYGASMSKRRQRLGVSAKSPAEVSAGARLTFVLCRGLSLLSGRVPIDTSTDRLFAPQAAQDDNRLRVRDSGLRTIDARRLV